ncbi:hypothetical protein EYF80_018485 [Liparis tanakae]|uniref:Uncharacterized protein n=1 Tax=Liparis tanakae TaxID=230148 RepID=A0A4Z2I212_9TELE|nr:hypothetical protein EYF80_018485 [Liparis tanakae]
MDLMELHESYTSAKLRQWLQASRMAAALGIALVGGPAVIDADVLPSFAITSAICMYRRSLPGQREETGGADSISLDANSMLHMNLSQCSQPMVGFSARPLSNASAARLINTTSARRLATLHMFTF